MLNFLFTKTPLLFLAQSFWRDESFSYLLSRKNIFQIITLTARDFNPPLYYFFLHFWMKIFGSSEIALRSLSLIFFWATLYVAYLFLREIFKLNEKKSFLYLLFFIINPLLIYYAFEARMYSMLAFFASLSLYSFYKKRSRIYLLSAILGLYTHYFMVFILAAQAAFALIDKEYKKFLKKIIYAFIVFIPWIIFIILQNGMNFQSFWIEKTNMGTLLNLLGIIYSGYEDGFKTYEKLLLPLSLIFILLIILGLKKRNKLFIYLFFWAVAIPLGAALISFVKPIFLPRYLIFSTVGLILLVIFILEHLPRPASALIIGLIIALSSGLQIAQLKERSKADVRRTITEIKTLAKKNDVLYVTNELEFFDAEYYFDENRVYIYGKSYRELPPYVGKILMPRDKVVNQLPFYPQKAFILTSTDHYEIQAAF